MSLLKDAGVPTPKFGVATTSAEARKIAEDLDTKDLVIKAQVRFGKMKKVTTYILIHFLKCATYYVLICTYV